MSLYKNGFKKEAETKQQKAKELLEKAVKKQAIEWKEFKQKDY